MTTKPKNIVAKHILVPSLSGLAIFLNVVSAMAQTAADTSASTSASYIEGGTWTYPSLTDVYLAGGSLRAEVDVDCAVLTTGHVDDCRIIAQDADDDPKTDNAVGAAYLEHAVLDANSVDGGILPGDRVKFHYMWRDLPHSDLTGAASLPSVGDAKHTVQGNWSYPSGDLMTNYYPDAAVAGEVEADVVVYCSAHSDGRIIGCQTLVDTAPGYGFGEATERLFEKYAHVDPSNPGEIITEGVAHDFVYHWRLSH